ncbi:MAG: RNA polymerase sigma factor [Prevotella sp.]|jgi:RNA polymerase sigma factor (sigma-70 family)
MNHVLTTKESLLSELFMTERENLYCIFRSAHIPEADCEDLVQDAFIKLMTIDLLRENTAKGLLYTIAYRMRTDYVRHLCCKKHTFCESPNSAVVEQEYVTQHMAAEELRACEKKAINRCSPLDSKVYCLSRFENKSTHEIAVCLHLSPRAVEGRLYRSRKFVRDYVYKVVNG